jgi:chromosome segregation ATPase
MSEWNEEMQKDAERYAADHNTYPHISGLFGAALQEIERLKARAEDYESARQGWKERALAAEQRVKELEQVNRDHVEAIDVTTRRIEELEQTIDKADEHTAALMKRVKELEAEMARLREALRGLLAPLARPSTEGERMMALKEPYQKPDVTAIDLGNLIDESERELSGLIEELREARRKLEDMALDLAYLAGEAGGAHVTLDWVKKKHLVAQTIIELKEAASAIAPPEPPEQV